MKKAQEKTNAERIHSIVTLLEKEEKVLEVLSENDKVLLQRQKDSNKQINISIVLLLIIQGLIIYLIDSTFLNHVFSLPLQYLQNVVIHYNKADNNTQLLFDGAITGSVISCGLIIWILNRILPKKK